MCNSTSEGIRGPGQLNKTVYLSRIMEKIKPNGKSFKDNHQTFHSDMEKQVRKKKKREDHRSKTTEPNAIKSHNLLAEAQESK